MFKSKKIHTSPSYKLKKSLRIRWAIEDGLSAEEITQGLCKQAKQGQVWAQFDLGYLHSAGQWVLQDDAQAYAWFDVAAENGDEDAKQLIELLSEDMTPDQLAEAQRLSNEYQKVCDPPRESERKSSGTFDVLECGAAVLWQHQAAEQGIAEEQFKLGEMYYRGEGGIYADRSKAEHWLHKAAEQGHPQAQALLDGMRSSKVLPDTETVRQVRKAAEQGTASEQCSLGHMYYYGYGVSQDFVQAARWYSKAAAQGNTFAQNQLGYMHFNGKGVTQDNDVALFWFHKAAEQGDALGQTYLGTIYHEGMGESAHQDFVQAAHWYSKAAAQGNAAAQTQLGLMYYEGKGVTQDCGEASQWYRKAAEQGWTEAQRRLGDMYANGKGVPKNDLIAYYWFSIAASQGDDPSKETLEIIVKRMRLDECQWEDQDQSSSQVLQQI